MDGTVLSLIATTLVAVKIFACQTTPIITNVGTNKVFVVGVFLDFILTQLIQGVASNAQLQNIQMNMGSHLANSVMKENTPPQKDKMNSLIAYLVQDLHILMQRGALVKIAPQVNLVEPLILDTLLSNVASIVVREHTRLKRDKTIANYVAKDFTLLKMDKIHQRVV